ncbi:M20 aminoacylase family protein [Hoeflea prorocentri]|uniref:M20 family metallopeptidase n=1 Tax=Hoeflea prorocentri TaxID=1922333 RepID=A0A9X3UII8_9HYPH|nr:M20 aminoacylase family protein [Hoeflea prorocentri]MCY6381977.1 M20 family metallopeptidase [Hoeflea prorocentri]MDA5399777.1 M20 family metallopeptidase [Hoeflea prorocentri]
MHPTNNRIADIVPEVKEWRRWLHRNPELLFDLPKTSAYIAERLREIGVDEIHENVAESGIVAVINGNADGPVIGLRADMDALPMDEISDIEHASETPGKMHACGHDGHSAMLLGAAKYLAETRNFAGKAVLIFQPAEEGGTGAKAMVDTGLFDRMGIDEVYGMHNMPSLPIGHFGFCEGPALAATDFFYVDIEGVGGHASRPHRCVDPVVAANAIYNAFQSIITRNADPMKNGLISITSIQAGDANNVIPQTAHLKGTVRNLHEETRDMIERRMQEIVDGIAQSHGVEIKLTYDRLCPVTINHVDQTVHAAEAAEKVVGAQNIDREQPARLGGEDFSYMLQEKPGTIVFIGNGETAGLHHPEYDFNDEAIPYGIAFWAKIIEDRLPLGESAAPPIKQAS